MNKSIPKYEFPDKISDYALSPDKIVKVTDIDFMPYYHISGIKGAITECCMRSEVYMRLKEAQSYLPKGYSFRIYDAWRPFEVQMSLYNDYRKKVRGENPEADEAEIDNLTKLFVSKPLKDIYDGPVHTTGGAIDLTITDTNGNEPDMGTEFDYFGERANTAYFELNRQNTEIRYNRRILYNAMIQAGFSNLPTEWWHYDYGNKFWAYYQKKKAIYGCIFEK